MAKNFSRNDRVSEQMQRDLAHLLQFAVKDPRVKGVTLTEIQVAGDLSHAKVFYTAAAPSDSLQQGLEKSAGYLRSQLAKTLLIRTVPQLHFTYDQSLDHGMKMSKLIDEAINEHQSDDDSE